MPFQILPDRTSGQLLGASYLNALSENTDYVYGLATRHNMPFQGYKNASIASINATQVYWWVRHRLRYLHYKVDTNDPLDYFRLKAWDLTTTTQLIMDEAPAFQSVESYVDTDGLLTVGTWYRLHLEIKFVTGSHSIKISRLVESDATAFGTETAGSYAVPPAWGHGDNDVSATEMNKYKSALDAAKALLGDEQMNVPVRKNNTEDRGFFLRNQYRWLHYIGNGEIVDPAAVGTTVTISGNGSAMTVYDLYGVDWLAPGVLYEVKDCLIACEDYAP